MSLSTMNRGAAISSDGLHHISCPKCHRANGVDRRFCGGCGESLWQVCVGCNHENPLSEVYCGRCGVNLGEKLREFCDLAQAAFTEAESLANQGAFFDAATSLKRIQNSNHPQLRTLHEQAQLRIQQYMADRAAAVKLESELLPRIQDLVKQAHFSLASELIERVPAGVRSPDLQALAGTVGACLTEIQELNRKIRQALKSGQLADVVADVDRLARLKPHDESVLKLKANLDARRQSTAQKTAIQVARQAKALLDQNQYVRAAEMVAKIPDEARQGTILTLCQHISELASLFDHLRLAPVATDSLIRVAQRSQKLRPQDPQWTALIDKLTKSLQLKPRDPRFGRPWTAQPESTALGRPVCWWTTLAYDQLSDGGRTVWDRHPGQLFVAAGLALQGLGLSRFPLNLPRPERTRSVWSAWAQTGTKSRQAPTVWGLDLGRRSLKAVCMSWNRKTHQLSIDDAYVAHHSSALTVSHSPDEFRDAQRQMIEEWLKAKNLKAPKVVLGLAGSRVLGRFFTVPGTDLKKIRGAVQFESKAQVPIPADAVSIDFHLEPLSDDAVRQTRVILAATRNEHIRQLLDCLPANQCDVLGVQNDATALFNAASHFLLSDASWLRPHSACAFLDVGFHSTNVVIGSAEQLWFRNIPFGMDRLHEQVASQLQLTKAQAVTACHELSGIPWLHQLDEVLSLAFREFLGEIRRTLEIFELEHDQQVSRVVGSGGGFAQLGLLRYLVHGK